MKPKHVGIILDGNRRFARKLGLDTQKGHELGYDKVKKLMAWCRKHGIKELTLYSFSVQNLDKRPKQEFNYLIDLFTRGFNELIDDKNIHENKVRVRAIGRTSLLPEKLQEAIREAEESTKDYDDYRVNIAIAYGGREEIIDAVKKTYDMAKEGKMLPDEITEEIFSKNLYISSDPDLIIRTGGERRLSNFLTWQSIYSELMFLDKMWPEFEEQDFDDCIREFEARDRRFGK